MQVRSSLNTTQTWNKFIRARLLSMAMCNFLRTLFRSIFFLSLSLYFRYCCSMYNCSSHSKLHRAKVIIKIIQRAHIERGKQFWSIFFSFHYILKTVNNEFYYKSFFCFVFIFSNVAYFPVCCTLPCGCTKKWIIESWTEYNESSTHFKSYRKMGLKGTSNQKFRNENMPNCHYSICVIDVHLKFSDF